MSDTIEDLLLWCEETFDDRIAIKMGMTRIPKKMPLPYANGDLPTFNQFRPGRDADCRTRTTTRGGPHQRPAPVYAYTGAP